MASVCRPCWIRCAPTIPPIQVLLDDLRAQERRLLESLNDLADPESQIDKAEELCRKWGTELGQLWQAGPHRLIAATAETPTPLGVCGRTARSFA